MDKELYLLENYKNIQDQIKFIDQKTSFVTVFYIFLLTSFKDTSEILVFKVNPNIIEFNLFIIGVIFLFHIGWQLYLILFKIIKPRTAKNYKIHRKSTFYYEHIGQMNQNDFKSNILNSNLDEKKEITNQIYEVSNILMRKTLYFKKAIDHLYISIVLAVLFNFLVKLI